MHFQPRLFTKIVFLFFFAFINSLVACKPTVTCPPPETYTRDFSPLDKSKVPYSGNDTLVFINSKTDTFSYFGSGKKTSYVISRLEGSPDCEWDKEANQCDIINFFSPKINDDIIITHSIHTLGGAEHVIVVTFNTSTFEFADDQVDYVHMPGYIDTITVQGKLYKGVCVFRSLDEKDKLYYNKTNGIVKVDIGNSTLVWNLK